MTLGKYPSRLISGTDIYKQTSKVKHASSPPVDDVDDKANLISTIKERLGRGFVRI